MSLFSPLFFKSIHKKKLFTAIFIRHCFQHLSVSQNERVGLKPENSAIRGFIHCKRHLTHLYAAMNPMRLLIKYSLPIFRLYNRNNYSRTNGGLIE